ncbi:TetR/AcrR family transcriptional regulator [Paenibacillus sp. M1]|uniref:TetR/AcrR family transcriptional regulator n=1 Tax=Paenibacillus haidiansis TaxID=1574488 RepID=A0ABU7VU28_9BACL
MDKRKIIIETAVRLFAEKGYASLTVDDIAKASGMTKPSFYKYFPGKEDLLLEAMTMFIEELEDKVNHLYRRTDISKRDRMIELIVIFLENIFNHRTYTLLFVVPILPVFQNKKIQRATAAIERKLFIWITESIVDLYGEQVEESALDFAFIACSILLSYTMMIDPRLSHDHCYKLAVYVEHMVGVLVEGLQKNGPNVPLLFDPPSWLMECPEDISPISKSRQLLRSFRNMELAVQHDSSLTEREKEDYLEAILKMKTETSDAPGKSIVFKALLCYLEQLDLLREECAQIKAIIES